MPSQKFPIPADFGENNRYEVIADCNSSTVYQLAITKNGATKASTNFSESGVKLYLNNEDGSFTVECKAE